MSASIWKILTNNNEGLNLCKYSILRWIILIFLKLDSNLNNILHILIDFDLDFNWIAQLSVDLLTNLLDFLWPYFISHTFNRIRKWFDQHADMVAHRVDIVATAYEEWCNRWHAHDVCKCHRQLNEPRQEPTPNAFLIERNGHIESQMPIWCVIVARSDTDKRVY